MNVSEIKGADKDHYIKCANSYLNILAKESFLSNQSNKKNTSLNVIKDP